MTQELAQFHQEEIRTMFAMGQSMENLLVDLMHVVGRPDDHIDATNLINGVVGESDFRAQIDGDQPRQAGFGKAEFRTHGRVEVMEQKTVEGDSVDPAGSEEILGFRLTENVPSDILRRAGACCLSIQPVAAAGATGGLEAFSPKHPNRADDTPTWDLGNGELVQHGTSLAEQSGKAADAVTFDVRDVVPLDFTRSMGNPAIADTHEIAQSLGGFEPLGSGDMPFVGQGDDR